MAIYTIKTYQKSKKSHGGRGMMDQKREWSRLASEVNRLRAEKAELEGMLEECVAWMDGREKMIPGLQRKAAEAHD